MKFRIVDNAWWMFWAKGMVVGRWIWFRKWCLYDDAVYRHEIEHVYQMKRSGRFRFYFDYLWLFLIHWYKNHPFEIAAREKENKKLTQREIRWRNQKKVTL